LNYLGVKVTRICVFVDGGGGEVVGNQFVGVGEVANFVIAVFEGDCGGVGAIGVGTSDCFE
jgi:hypothetical protein